MWRFNSPTGVVTQLVQGFGIGAVAANLFGNGSTLDFSRLANSSLIAALRRF